MLISSCIPEPESPTIEVSENSQLMKVRQWFEENKTTLRLPERGSNFRTDAQELILPFFEKEPDWDQFHHYYFPDGREVFEVSLENANRYFPKSMLDSFPDRNPQELAVQNIMFIKNPSGNRFDPLIARYFPADEYSINHQKNISYNSLDEYWSGKIDIFTYDEHHFIGFTIEDGELISTNKYSEGVNNSNSKVQGDCRTSIYEYSVVVPSPGSKEEDPGQLGNQIVNISIVQTTCTGSMGDDRYYEFPPQERDPDSPTDGNNSCSTCEYDPPKIPKPNFKISNKISFREYPCLSSSVNKAVDKNFSNEIQDLILDVFGESEDFNIEIEAFDFEDDTLDGTCYPAIVDPTSNYAKFIITINTLLENSSNEYITATVFHEFLHAYMNYLNLPNVRYNDIIDHNEMANKYLKILSQILVDQYGISMSHAEALSWGGLGETDLFQKLSVDKINAIVDINKDYKNGTKGTKCN